MSNRAQKMYKLLKNYNGNFNYQYNESSEPSNKYVEIPKYVFDGSKNIPEDLKKVIDYFKDSEYKNYQVCLVGKEETLKTDFKTIYNDANNFLQKNEENNIAKKVVKISKKMISSYSFIHLTDENIKGIYSGLPINIKNAIHRINKLVSNPTNEFNSIHTLGLVLNSEVKTLNEFGYGLTSWNTIKIYVSCTRGPSNDYTCPPDLGCVYKKCEDNDSKFGAYMQCSAAGLAGADDGE